MPDQRHAGRQPHKSARLGRDIQQVIALRELDGSSVGSFSGLDGRGDRLGVIRLAIALRPKIADIDCALRDGQEDWKGKYGAEGAMVAGDRGTTEAPKCATVAIRNHQDVFPWAANPADPTKLQLTGKNPGRSITCWNAGDQIFVDIEIADGKEHRVAIYLALGNCPLSVEVQDADTKAVLDTQSVKEAGKGERGNKYLVWNLKGNVTVNVGNTAESAERHELWIGGLFFDPPAREEK